MYRREGGRGRCIGGRGERKVYRRGGRGRCIGGRGERGRCIGGRRGGERKVRRGGE